MVYMQGQALYEECLFDEKGKQINHSFLDYKMPTAVEAPLIFESEHIITDDPYGPFGAKGAGESSCTTTLAAIVNAVYDAVGVRIKDLPITPEKILKGLKEKKSSDWSWFGGSCSHPGTPGGKLDKGAKDN